MTKNLSFKTKQSSVAQSVFKWQCFEEKLSFYQNWIQKFSVEIIQWQPTKKELLNPNGLAKIILLELVRSHFYQIFWLLKKLKAAVKYIALKLSNMTTKSNRLNDFLVLVEKLEIHWFRLKNLKPIPKKLKTEAVHRSKYHKITRNWFIWTYISFREWYN